MINFVNRSQPQYKANLHSHSNLSDGELTPEEMVKAYREHGYSVLAITDHEYPRDNTELSFPDSVNICPILRLRLCNISGMSWARENIRSNI